MTQISASNGDRISPHPPVVRAHDFSNIEGIESVQDRPRVETSVSTLLSHEKGGWTFGSSGQAEVKRILNNEDRPFAENLTILRMTRHNYNIAFELLRSPSSNDGALSMSKKSEFYQRLTEADRASN